MSPLLPRFIFKLAINSVFLVLLFFMFVYFVGLLFAPNEGLAAWLPYLLVGAALAFVVMGLVSQLIKLPWWANLIAGLAAFPCATLIINLLIIGASHG